MIQLLRSVLALARVLHHEGKSGGKGWGLKLATASGLSMTPGFLELFPWEKGMLLCKGMPGKFKQPFIVPSHLDGISFFAFLS